METLDTAGLKKMMQQHRDFVLINVLPEEAFQKEHIPNSRNIPLADDNFEDRVKQAAQDKDARIVVYCASRECDASPKAAKQLEKAGFSHVQDYEVGMKGWRDAGLPVQSAAELVNERA